jgi:O-antigen/teichoic acid export membrane protein
VVFFAMRWQGRLIGIVVSYTLLSIYAFWYFYQCGYLLVKFSKKYIQSELIYAIPIVIMQMSIFSLNTADKFILAKISNSRSEVGIYSIACILGSMIVIFSTAYLTYLFLLFIKYYLHPI